MFLATSSCSEWVFLKHADAFPQVFGYVGKVEVLLQFFHSRFSGAKQLDPFCLSGQRIETVDGFRVWEVNNPPFGNRQSGKMETAIPAKRKPLFRKNGNRSSLSL
jgi:hypothetical protein